MWPICWPARENKTITRAYTGYRHEIHNELTIRDEVEAGLVEFVNQVLG